MHYGAEWSVRGLQGEVINAYSPETFEERMRKLLTETLTIIEKEQIDHIDMVMCGDALDGMLRASQ